MDKTLGIFSLLALLLVIVTAAMVSTTALPAAEGPDGAVNVATAFVKGEPTYKFDGMEETLKVDVTGTFPEPGTYEVTATFTSAHGGYGDRTGLVVPQVLTPHSCVLMVENGEVTKAIMDGAYDMVAQKFLK